MASDRPEDHYDRVTAAWRYLLGENLHWGVFDADDEPLTVATDRLTSRMAEHGRLADAPGLRVLDVGCGIGTPALHLAATYDAVVTGITISQQGVDLARRKAAASPVGQRVTFLKADAQDNGLPAASFDRAWVMESSHLMPDKPAMIAECARTLAPGGRLVLCDLVHGRPLTQRDVLSRAKAFNLLRLAFGRAVMAPLDAYAGWCEAAGLVVDDRVDLGAAALPTLDRWEENARDHAAAVIDLIGAQGHADFAASCAVLRDLFREGLLSYALITAHKPD